MTPSFSGSGRAGRSSQFGGLRRFAPALLVTGPALRLLRNDHVQLDQRGLVRRLSRRPRSGIEVALNPSEFPACFLNRSKRRGTAATWP